MPVNRAICALLLALATVGSAAQSLLPVPPGFDLYREPITTPHHLDWLWQAYLEEGELAAIEKITSALELGAYAGAIDRARQIRQQRELTTNEKNAAVLDAVLQATMWSLESNARQHAAVLTELTRIEAESRKQAESGWHALLLVVLSKAAPDQFRIVDQNDGVTFSTPTGRVRFSRSGSY